METSLISLLVARATERPDHLQQHKYNTLAFSLALMEPLLFGDMGLSQCWSLGFINFPRIWSLMFNSAASRAWGKCGVASSANLGRCQHNFRSSRILLPVEME